MTTRRRWITFPKKRGNNVLGVERLPDGDWHRSQPRSRLSAWVKLCGKLCSLCNAAGFQQKWEEHQQRRQHGNNNNSGDPRRIAQTGDKELITKLSGHNGASWNNTQQGTVPTPATMQPLDTGVRQPFNRIVTSTDLNDFGVVSRSETRSRAVPTPGTIQSLNSDVR